MWKLPIVAFGLAMLFSLSEQVRKKEVRIYILIWTNGEREDFQYFTCLVFSPCGFSLLLLPSHLGRGWGRGGGFRGPGGAAPLLEKIQEGQNHIFSPPSSRFCRLT